MLIQQDGFVEDRSYDHDHVAAVVAAIASQFDMYFAGYLGLSSVRSIPTSVDDASGAWKRKLAAAIRKFDDDREAYLEIMDIDALEEYESDPSAFHKALSNDCPIIRKTLHSDEAELKRFKINFRSVDKNELFIVVWNLASFAQTYVDDFYDESTYDNISAYDELEITELDEDDYRLYGAVGGGIRSHLLYKVNPAVFPNRSKAAIWALYFISGEQDFGLASGSEFLKLDQDMPYGLHNFHYPYELFTFYTHQIYQMLREKAEQIGVYLDPAYRYVFVDDFLSYISERNEEAIKVCSRKPR